MKLRVADIKRFAVHDGDGIRTTVFLKGCSLRCIWCHNPECEEFAPELAYYAHKCIGCGKCAAICESGVHRVESGMHILQRQQCVHCGKCIEICPAEALKLYGAEMAVGEIMETVMADCIFYESSGGGLTVSGGEPLCQSAGCTELLKQAKAQGIHTAVDTCGAVPWSAFASVLPYTDIFLYDLKHMDDEKHRELTGMGNAQILKNLVELSHCGKHVEIRIPLIPSINSTEENLHAAGKFLGGLSNINHVKILQYHDLARSKYTALGKPDTMPRLSAPTREELDAAVHILRTYGVNAVSGLEA